MKKIKENISDNIICNWEIINKQSDNINIISVVYFVYNQDKKYEDGLLKLINKFRKILNNYYLRIYYDDSSKKNIMRLLDKTNHRYDKYIELFKYDIPKLKVNKLHGKTVGTLIRFMPLFDYKLHKVNKCIIFDIDNNLHYYYKKLDRYFTKNNITIAYRSRACYYINKRILCTNTFNYPIIASFIYKSKNTPKNIYQDFFEEFFIKKNKDYLNKCDLKDEYSYGIDEIFMNDYYLNYFYKNQIVINPILFNHYDIINGINKFIRFSIIEDDLNYFKLFLVDFFNLFNIKLELNNKNKDEIKDIIKNIKLDSETIKNINKKRIY